MAHVSWSIIFCRVTNLGACIAEGGFSSIAEIELDSDAVRLSRIRFVVKQLPPRNELSQMSIEMLHQSQLCCGLSDEQIHAVAETVRKVKYSSGQSVFRQNDPGDSLFIVEQGRVRVDVIQTDGRVRLIDNLDVGEHFGEVAMLTGGVRAVTMTAVTDCELLELKQQAFHSLLQSVPGLAANVCRTLGYQLRRETAGRPPRVRTKIIGLVNSAHLVRAFLPRFAAALASECDHIDVLTDIEQPQMRRDGYSMERVPLKLRGRDKTAWIEQRLSQSTPHSEHVLLNVVADQPIASLNDALSHCEQILWLVEPRRKAAATRQLRELLKSEPNMANRIHITWILREGLDSVPPVLDNLEVAQPDFKVVLSESEASPSRRQRQSISRIVRHVRGSRLGLALGGGAARGMAHLGVLHALEREGIDFDLISGTSVGALMALPYAFGWDLNYAVAAFKRDLTPGWFLRRLPSGNQWFMLFKYRTRGWEPMLRRHFGDVRLEQLHIPLSTVAVDLVSGRQVVRDCGDAVNAVLESINLPSISRPILRDSMALVDGGIFNNVPADLLPDRGADLVIGIDVAASLSQQFAGNTPTTPTRQMRHPGQLETIMRANEVQDHEITALRTKAVDLMISVDTCAFDFADFTKATELAAIGERAAEAAMPRLKQLLAKQRESNSLSGSRFVCASADCTEPAHHQ